MPSAHPPELRHAAVAHAAEHGVTAAARQYGVSKGSVSHWAHAAGVGTVQSEKTAVAVQAAAEQRALRREALRDDMLGQAEEMLRRMNVKHIDFKGTGPLGPVQVEYPLPRAADCQHYATSFAILLDKYRLELGEVTARTEHMTVDVIDAEIRALEAELA